MKFLKFSVLLILTCTLSKAGAREDCPGKVDMFKGVQAQSFFYKSAKSCVVLVSPTNKGAKWRSYSFYSNGLLMIFNNMGPGPQNTDTSSRSFFIFPRKKNPAYAFTSSGLLVGTSSGERVIFDFKNSLIKATPDSLKLKEDPRVNGHNDGGVEVQAHGGVVIDTGYLVGEVAHSVPSAYSKVSDRRGKSCRLRNDLLFTYIYGADPYGKQHLEEVNFKFETDREFAIYLQQTCPSLDVGPLVKDLTRSVAAKSRKTRSRKI
jgi:hypothetical protein